MTEELNRTVKAKLAPSKIHGIGVFAIRDIKKGERIYAKGREDIKWLNLTEKELSELRPEIKELILQRWPGAILGHSFLSPNNDARLISFMNDGKDDSNYDPHTDTALRDIRLGEEITEDYNNL